MYMRDPGDIELLDLQTIDPYLQRSHFGSLESMIFFTEYFDSEIVQDWVRETLPACFQRGIVQIRKPPWQA